MTDTFIPSTSAVRDIYVGTLVDEGEANESEAGAEFDRWFIREIEAAEYSGYLRAKDERN